MKRLSVYSFFLCLGFSLTLNDAHATPEEALQYVNALAFRDQVNRLRGSFDRFDNVVTANEEMQNSIYKRGFLYGYQMDLSPHLGTLGFAYGTKRLRFYGLAYTTDIQFQSEDKFRRAAAGINLNATWLQLQADASMGDAGLFYYGKVSSAPLKSNCMVALNPFYKADDEHLVLSKDANGVHPNMYRCETALIPYFNSIGADVDVVLDYVRPDLTLSLSGLLDDFSSEEDVLAKIPVDVELRVFNTMQKLTDFSDLTTILSLYYVSESNFGKSKKLNIVNRAMAFVSFAYRTGNILVDKLKAEGVPEDKLGKQKGVGVEGGIGLRVFGMTKHGFPSADYVKLTGYYNFPEYHNVYPYADAGVRLHISY